MLFACKKLLYKGHKKPKGRTYWRSMATIFLRSRSGVLLCARSLRLYCYRQQAQIVSALANGHVHCIAQSARDLRQVMHEPERSTDCSATEYQQLQARQYLRQACCFSKQTCTISLLDPPPMRTRPSVTPALIKPSRNWSRAWLVKQMTSTGPTSGLPEADAAGCCCTCAVLPALPAAFAGGLRAMLAAVFASTASTILMPMKVFPA